MASYIACLAQKKCCDYKLEEANKIARITGNYRAADSARKEGFYCIYADSIDNILAYKKIPMFLYDDDFDENEVMWPGSDYPISVRMELLKRVKNVNALRYIICLNDTSMKKINHLLNEKDTSNDLITELSLIRSIPYIHKSFYDLIVWRYYMLMMKDTLIDENSPSY